MFPALTELAKESFNKMSFDDEIHAGYVRSADDMLPYLCTTINVVQRLLGSSTITIPVAAKPGPKSSIPKAALWTFDESDTPEQVYSPSHLAGMSPEKAAHIEACRWHFVKLITVVEYDDADPLDANPDAQTRGREYNIAQARPTETFVGKILDSQPRNFVFIIRIYRNTFHIQRWDRGSMIFSDVTDSDDRTALNYQKDPSMLVEFFSRLPLLSKEGAGYDPTIQPLRPFDNEVTLMKTMIRSYRFDDLPAYIRDLVKFSMQDVLDPPSPPLPLYKVAVPRKDKPRKKRYFIVGRPISPPNYLPIGDGTKIFVAFDLERLDFVQLKDYWRPLTSNAESDIYKQLAKRKVPNVATLRHGGDISGHITLNGRPLNDFRQLVHHRLVLSEIGEQLNCYQNGQSLCRIVHDAMIGHQRAWEDAHVLHCNISDDNIIIVLGKDSKGKETPRGVLINWELAMFRPQLGAKANGNRTGSWQHNSALRLQYPAKPHELADDLESFVHIINLSALQFHKHNLDPEELGDHLYLNYLNWGTRGNVIAGCDAKIESVKEGDPGFELQDIPENVNLSAIIKKLMELCQEHYNSVDHDFLERYLDLPEEFVKKTLRGPSATDHDNDDKAESSNAKPWSSPLSSLVKGSPLSTHTKMINALKEVIGRPGWAKIDTVSDQFVAAQVDE
ncbi:hypothetical protein K474DRAFT_1697867 [Panus rudis PR-1116 ss-1]|nr:hypothetical protein K474DRAFT_1697867 [Panus rudis PR-1116 ss-1]